jgi:hypothetical protein
MVCFFKPFIKFDLFPYAKNSTSGKRVQDHQISMIEHISLSFPPYCGIFNSTQREPSARETFQPAAWLTQVASLASRHEQNTVRAAFFCLYLPFQKLKSHATALPLSDISLLSPTDGFNRIPVPPARPIIQR